MMTTTVSAPQPADSMLIAGLLHKHADHPTGQRPHDDMTVFRQKTPGEQGSGCRHDPAKHHSEVLFAADHHGKQKAADDHVEPETLRLADHVTEIGADSRAQHAEHPQ